jgi:hypothetical protein
MQRIVVALFAVFVIAAPVLATPDLHADDAQYAPLKPPRNPSRPSGPITITAGGTYSGKWRSSTLMPAVRISTTEPVVIHDAKITNLSGGPLVVTDWPLAANVTLRRVKAFGGTGRFFEAEGFRSIRIAYCTIEKTGGIKLVGGADSASVVVTRNKQRNVQGPSQGASERRQFVQFAEVQTATIDVSWNQVINEFGKSEAEDVISIYKTAHARVHDNYLQGGYPLRNVEQSSANGITVEIGEGVGPTSFDNAIWSNTVVDNVGGIGLVGGRDSRAHHNRIVQDGKLDDGSRLRAANVGLAVWNIGRFPGFVNNRAHDNVVGYVNGTGRRSDFWFPDSPGDYARNTSRRGTVTHATEQAEWTAWLAKLKANRIRVGA